MSADRLLDGFNLLGDEPETVQQFRKLVVGLAVSGKLTAKCEASSDASTLMKLIEEKKTRARSEGTASKTKCSAEGNV